MILLPAAALFTGVCGAMAALSPIGSQAGTFTVLYVLLWGLLAALYAALTSERDTSGRWAMVIGLGLAARCAFLFFPPALDVNRYVWEGLVQIAGMNPYLLAPDAPALAELAAVHPVLHAGVNHPDMAAAYPPLFLLFSRLFAAWSADPWHFKLAVWAAEALGMVLIVLAARRRGLGPERALLYAANPLVLVFLSGEAHLEGVQMLFLGALVLLLATRDKSVEARAGAGAFLALGLASMIKYFAALGLPLLLSRRNVRLLPFFLLPWLSFIPFLDAGGDLFASLSTFGIAMHYNDPLTSLMRPLLGSLALPAAALLLAVALAAIWLTVPGRFAALAAAFLALLLFLPTLHPWYLALLMPLLPFVPLRSALWLGFAVCLTFPVLGTEYRTGVFQEIHWLKLPEYLPLAVFLVWDVLRPPGRRRFGRPVSVLAVVPTLNEQAHLERCLRALGRQPEIERVLVADGGSSDATLRIAESCGATVVSGSRGRGVQVRHALSVHPPREGEVVLVVHADTLLPEAGARRILDGLEARRDSPGGAHAMSFEQGGGVRRVLSTLNNLRARLTSLSFGDQAQFARAEALAATGGFPGLPLMEDVELPLRLKELGPLLLLRDPVRVSARRWLGPGSMGEAARIVRLFTHYLLLRRLLGRMPDTRRFYRNYYGDSSGTPALRQVPHSGRTASGGALRKGVPPSEERHAEKQSERSAE